jgi:1,4-alpha-glucan branching enzyme
VIELLGGPLTHTFTPHLADPLIDLSLQAGLADTTARVGHRPTGIWAPECAYRPGLEQFYARHRVGHFMVDGPTLQRAGAPLHQPHRIGDTDVVAFGRDLELTYRVWSPDSGYPGDPWYLDFHSFDHAWGMRSYRVTNKQSDAKDPYEPEATAASIDRDVDDFISAARTIMLNSPTADPVIVAAYDTELFGHWWHEGPAFLARLLDKVPDAGIQLTTLSRERSRADDSPPIELPSGSWGSGKDFRVWEEGEAGELHTQGRTIQNAVCKYLASHRRSHSTGRDHFGDALATETLLALASDWAFMITKDSAADYARNRADGHFQRVAELLHGAGHEPEQSRIPTRDTRLPFLDSRTWRPASHAIGIP